MATTKSKTDQFELPKEGFVRMKHLVKNLNISRATLLRWVKQNRFPQPQHLGPKVVVWDVRKIREFIAQ